MEVRHFAWVVARACVLGAWVTLAAGLALADAWTAPAAVTSISLDPDVLRDLGLERTGDLPTGRSPGFPGSAYRTVPPSLLRFDAPRGDFETFASGSLRHAGGFVLTPRTGEPISLYGFELRVAAGLDDFHLLDASGTHWLSIRQMQFTAAVPRQELWIVNASIHLSDAFATRLGRPALTDAWIGVANLRLPAILPDEVAAAPQGVGVCDASTELPVDVALTLMLGLSQVAREPGGRVALTQATVLENVGQAAVVWGEAIAPPLYGVVDEHPFLTQAFYRLDTNGRIVQLGTSDVKHTFRALNTSCSCPSSNVFYPGCLDSYSSATNADRHWLGPRDEVNAHLRTWQRVGSHFDQCLGIATLPCNPATDDMDDFRDHEGDVAAYHDSFEHRLLVPETGLQAAGTFYTEAWYLAAGDVDLWNSMAHRPVVPSFAGSTWTFASGGATVNASILDEVPGATRELLDTGEGRLQLAVTTTDLGGGVHHYEYALMNFDFDRQIDVFDVPIGPAIAVTNASSAGLGGDPANDWTATVLPSVLRFAAPPGGELSWGRLASFGFDANAAPTAGAVILRPHDAPGPTSFDVPAPTPVPEPAAALLAAVGLTTLAALARRRNGRA